MQHRVHVFSKNRKPALTVTMINIPLSISLAIASGATPLQGLLTAFWAGLLASIFCSSHHNIYGPAGSLAGILLPIGLTYGITYLPFLAIFGGLIMLLIGALQLSKYIVLIPLSALQGFLLGIGLIIGLQQIPAALGLPVDLGLTQILANVASINPVAVCIFVVSIIILQSCKKRLPQVPGTIVVTILGVIVGRFLVGQSSSVLDLLLDRYPDVSFTFFQVAELGVLKDIFSNSDTFKAILIASVGVAVIAVLETLISSKMAFKQTRVYFDGQREIYGLGITNLLAGLVGSLPSSGLVPRTGMNIRAGATHKLSGGMVGVTTALLSYFLFTGALSYLPFAVTAAILIDVALGMINVSMYHKMRKLEKSSILIIILVGSLSYIWDPMMGILVGAVMALLGIVNRSMQADLMTNVFREGHHVRKLPLSEYESFQKPGDVLIIKLEGELNYLTTESHIQAMQTVRDASVIILGFGHTATIDIDALEEITLMIQDRLQDDKIVYLTGVDGQKKHMMGKSGVYHHLEKNGFVYASKSEVLEKVLDGEK